MQQVVYIEGGVLCTADGTHHAVYVCTHIRRCVCGVWCIHKVVCTLQAVCTARGWAASSLSCMRHQSGAVGGQRHWVWAHCHGDPTGSSIRAVGQLGQWDREECGAERLV